MPNPATCSASCSGANAPSFKEKNDRTSRCTKDIGRGPSRGRCSVPESFHMPPIRLAVEVEVPDGAAVRPDGPAPAVAAVRPPPPLDPPAADHVDDLVALASPFEDGRHPSIALDPDLFVEPLGHPSSRSR